MKTEVARRVESSVLGQQLATLFDESIAPDQAFHVELIESGKVHSALFWFGEEAGQPVRYDNEPLASWWRRIFSALLGALAPEELL